MKKTIFTDYQEDYRYLESMICENESFKYLMITIDKDCDVDGLIELDIETAKDFVKHLQRQINQIDDA